MAKAYAETAVAFASALNSGDWKRAHALLVPSLQDTMSPSHLEREFHRLFPDSVEGSRTVVQFDEQFAMDDWPDKQPGDAGWVYVSIVGEEVIEAVTVIVADAGGALGIRSVEWGRP
ncbi:MAG TPA: hypothetical protein VEB19_12715 [Gemmatimonadaceae bacterium]|nr:hypothetical protein [Gemmatimonadaceae bacterium]